MNIINMGEKAADTLVFVLALIFFRFLGRREYEQSIKSPESPN